MLKSKTFGLDCLSKGLVCLNLARALLAHQPSRLDLQYH